MICTYVQPFPSVEWVQVAEGMEGFRMELVDSLRKAKPTLRMVVIMGGSRRLVLKVDAQEQQMV